MTLTSRKQLTTHLSAKTFHHNMTGNASITLDSGQTIDFEKLRQIDFGNVNADVLADKDPHFKRVNFCSVIRGSAWPG